MVQIRRLPLALLSHACSKVPLDWLVQTSKVALTLFSRELARRLAGTQVSVITADPGVTGETALFR